MGICNYLNRDCSFTNICNFYYKYLINKKTENIIKYDDDEITIIQYKLGIRKIMKFEGDFKEIKYSDKEKIEEKLKKYLNEYSLGYSSTDLTGIGYGFFIGGNNELGLRKFMNYNYESDEIIKILKVGIMMGYIECCIKNYIRLSKEIGYNSNLDKFYEDNILDNNSHCPLISLSRKFFVHFPCSSKCEETLKKSEKVLSYIINMEGEKIIREIFL